MDGEEGLDLLQLTTHIVAAHVSHNRVAVGEVPDLIARVHGALDRLDGVGPAGQPTAGQKPAVPVRNSVKHDHIICLEDGRKLKMLKRYLMAQHGLTPDQYRAKWNLRADYPMVAPAYADRRRELAQTIGLGRKPAQPSAPAPARKPRGRKRG